MVFFSPEMLRLADQHRREQQERLENCRQAAQNGDCAATGGAAVEATGGDGQRRTAVAGVAANIHPPTAQGLHQGQDGALGHSLAAGDMELALAQGCNRGQEAGGSAVVAEKDVLGRGKDPASGAKNLPAFRVALVDGVAHGRERADGVGSILAGVWIEKA